MQSYMKSQSTKEKIDLVEKTDQCAAKKDSILWFRRAMGSLFFRFESIGNTVR